MAFGAGTLPAGWWFETHEHPQHQIAWASSGVIAVEVGEGRWMLPPTRALWIPGGTRHRTGTSGGALMRGIFVEPEQCTVSFAAPTMLKVSRLLYELFDYLSADGTATEQRRRAEAVIFDLVEPVDVIPIGAPWPADPRAHRVATALARNPADERTLAEFAAAASTSTRTLARSFATETGISFGQWRTQIRLATALPLLAAGMPIARIASRVGYATPSAFVAAFRREVGVSPGQYFSD